MVCALGPRAGEASPEIGHAKWATKTTPWEGLLWAWQKGSEGAQPHSSKKNGPIDLKHEAEI